VFLRFSIVLSLSLGIVFACECSAPSVQVKREHSDVIFRGTIIALKDSEKAAGIAEGWGRDTKKIAVFRVIRFWKGQVGKTFEMPAVEETSACIGFWPPYLKVGSDLLVYASGHGGAEYYTSIYGFHMLSKDVDEDFKELGTGVEPKENAK
jgi:hypothetical protein